MACRGNLVRSMPAVSATALTEDSVTGHVMSSYASEMEDRRGYLAQLGPLEVPAYNLMAWRNTGQLAHGNSEQPPGAFYWSVAQSGQ